eukprot:COSAG05_NODE_473_length_9490_cov_16.326696_3_plen_103_part_00
MPAVGDGEAVSVRGVGAYRALALFQCRSNRGHVYAVVIARSFVIPIDPIYLDPINLDPCERTMAGSGLGLELGGCSYSPRNSYDSSQSCGNRKRHSIYHCAG